MNFTPTEELEIRQLAADGWRIIRPMAPDLTPEQSFSEGYLLAFRSGVTAARQIREQAHLKTLRLESLVIVWQLCTAAVFVLALLR